MFAVDLLHFHLLVLRVNAQQSVLFQLYQRGYTSSSGNFPKFLHHSDSFPYFSIRTNESRSVCQYNFVSVQNNLFYIYIYIYSLQKYFIHIYIYICPQRSQNKLQITQSNLRQRDLRPSWSFKVRSLALVRPCLGLSPLQCPCSLPPYFVLLFYYDSSACFFLLLYPSCSHVCGILWTIHTSCTGSHFLIVHAKWSLVFRSFGTTLY